MNVAGDESVRFEDNVFTADRPFNLTVDHNALSLDATAD
jgi:hypothetical protein